MSSFCTNRRIAKSSFTPSKLRFRYLALHKNNLIISDFGVVESLRSLVKLRSLEMIAKRPNLFVITS
jgi:hypothetical protein